MRSMIASLSQSIDKILEIDKKMAQIDKKEQDKKFIYNFDSFIITIH